MVMTTLQSENDRTGRKEQQRLEESMRRQVEHPGHERAHPDRRHHETELRNGRVGQHLLDVVLANSNRGRKQRRHCAGHGHHILRLRDKRIKRRGTRHQVHARRDHGGGMDERRDRGRAGHRVGQPDVKRNLRRFAGHAKQHEERDGHDDARHGMG